MARVAFIYGKKLAAARDELSLTQRELGQAIGVSDESVSRYERVEVARTLSKHLPRLAAALRMSLEHFKSVYCPSAEKIAQMVRQPPAGRRANGQLSMPCGLDLRLAAEAHVLPEFAIGIAANRRVDKLADFPDANRLVAAADRRAFVAPVDGDCQHPKWHDGELVIFSYDAVEREGILPGHSYYIAFTDGSTTFKRLFFDELDPEIFVLRCWNREKYPGDHRVHRDEVVRVARAVSKQISVVESE